MVDAVQAFHSWFRLKKNVIRPQIGSISVEWSEDSIRWT